MSIMTWSASNSVKVAEIDDQHKKLFVLVNDVHTAMLAGKGKEIMADVLKKLIDYTAYHFGAEEKYMVKFNYPEYKQHKAEHDTFVHKALSLQKDFQAGKLNLTLEVMNFLKDWVTKHIDGTDKKYTATFNKNGLK